MRMDPKGPKAYALTLEIKNVGNADAGSYKIVAKNDLGESNATIKLNFDSKYGPQDSPRKFIFSSYNFRVD